MRTHLLLARCSSDWGGRGGGGRRLLAEEAEEEYDIDEDGLDGLRKQHRAESSTQHASAEG